ncbi:mitochondrial F1F0 ATP synthase-like protein subunit F [Terfezia boudieri ATCC MYA-4762]|uniref:Mitochondrial F1F0 ATP synthase-like protein subunit F n=1 Tax=Terfezia boudieri ATCC MYA-4762 TaxID=1051890 RepID=A0A3N4LWG4_9PEZI|nr:mitochondrial F1F0 ATP synthase-like protein subunit F [Terfezia boudieri ATCC MYA-4762]
MSFIAKRGISTLIPPKVASPAGLGAAKDAVRMSRVVDFYTKLPKGPAPPRKTPGLLGGYQDKYFGKKASGMPIVHVIVGIMAIGYAQAYYFHIRHHKNNAH